MTASRRFPMSRFQPGIAAMYACTGASPSAFAICGFPPARSATGARFAAPRAPAAARRGGLAVDARDWLAPAVFRLDFPVDDRDTMQFSFESAHHLSTAARRQAARGILAA